jgi:Putative heavy-metal chelation
VEDLLAHLRSRAIEQSRDYPDEDFVLRGLWSIDYRYRPNEWERDLSYGMLMAQTTGQGCCYVDYGAARIDESCLGKDGRTLTGCDRATEIAVLDAVYSVFDKQPEQTFEFKGTSSDKAVTRARIVVDEVLKELADLGGERVLNVGVMGIFIRQLKDAGVEVISSDFHESIVGKRIHDAEVVSGEHTLDLAREVDVVLATGMTLTTDTLGPILDAAHGHGARVILFAATGAHFAQEYCQGLGVDVVVSEPQPQYMFQGTTSISVFRQRSAQVEAPPRQVAASA